MKKRNSGKIPPGLMGKYISALQKAYKEFIKIRGNPHEISLGLALGLFISMSPTMGFQIVIAVFFAALLKWNKVSAVIGVWITNPLTAPFIYGTTYFLGASIMGGSKTFPFPKEMSIESFFNMLSKTPKIFLTLTLGGIVVGIPLAVAGYFLAYSVLKKNQERLERNQERIKTYISNKKEKLALRKKRKRKKKKKK